MRLDSQMVNKKITFTNWHINQKCNGTASGCTIIVFLFLKSKLSQELSQLYLLSPTAMGPVAPSNSSSLSFNLFLPIYLWLMCTTRIINGDNLNSIFLSFNLCSSCLSALPGHLGNLHHYHLSPALYLPLLTLFPTWATILAPDPWWTVFLSVSILRILAPVFCQMTAAPS